MLGALLSAQMDEACAVPFPAAISFGVKKPAIETEIGIINKMNEQTESLSDGDLIDILEELDQIQSDDGDEAPYERTVEIHFPEDVAKLYSLNSLVISVRRVLDTYLLDHQDEQDIKGIRDNFYGGDHPDDYTCDLYEGANPNHTIEDIARAKVALADSHDVREQNRKLQESRLAEEKALPPEVHVPTGELAALEKWRLETLDPMWDRKLSHWCDYVRETNADALSGEAAASKSNCLLKLDEEYARLILQYHERRRKILVGE